MGVSKVNLGDETLVDLTGDTVTSQNLLKGATAHGADGEPVEGAITSVPLTTSLAVTEEGISALDGAVGKMLNDKFGGCSFEQEGNDFYIVGADAVRKKLGNEGSSTITIPELRAGTSTNTISFDISGFTSFTIGGGTISTYPYLNSVGYTILGDNTTIASRYLAQGYTQQTVSVQTQTIDISNYKNLTISETNHSNNYGTGMVKLTDIQFS